MRQLAAIIFNYIVGAGIFVLPALAASRLGPAAVLAYLVCAVIVGLMVLCFAEAGSRVAGTGGPYAYAEAAFGSYVGVHRRRAQPAVGGVGDAAPCRASSPSSLLALAGVTAPAARPLVMVAVVGGGRGRSTSAASRAARGSSKWRPSSSSCRSSASSCSAPSRARADPGLDRHAAGVGRCLRTAGLIILAFVGIESALQPSGEVRDAGAHRAARGARSPWAAWSCCTSRCSWWRRGCSVRRWRANASRRWRPRPGRPSARWRAYVDAGRAPPRRCSATCPVRSWPVRAALFALGRDSFLPARARRGAPDRHTPHVAIVVYAVVSLGARA